MIPISIKICIVVVLILNQMLNINASEDKEYDEDVLINSQYNVEKINLTWIIPNYSQIFSNVKTQFSQNHSSTTWVLSLENKRIYLKRIDTGEPVLVRTNFTLISKNKTIQDEKTYKFVTYGNEVDYLQLFKLEEERSNIPIQFENDVFVLKIAMKILGPVRSKIERIERKEIPQ